MKVVLHPTPESPVGEAAFADLRTQTTLTIRVDEDEIEDGDPLAPISARVVQDVLGHDELNATNLHTVKLESGANLPVHGDVPTLFVAAAPPNALPEAAVETRSEDFVEVSYGNDAVREEIASEPLQAFGADQAPLETESVNRRLKMPEEEPEAEPYILEWTADIGHLLREKAEEFAMLGYGMVQPEDLWDYFQSLSKSKRPTSFHALVNRILCLQPHVYMTYTMKNAFKVGHVEDYRDILPH
ncbi:post-transcriptional regulator [Ferroacidibacillus organovorans]|uniref:post-transcriptional regulator n=1 Tax=Ferroacidibacillus organovorans TaxID=1765683 RepID=UPI001E2F5A77|nr:post-transcriptional regulator [Ferroacidibacillus organovorans]